MNTFGVGYNVERDGVGDGEMGLNSQASERRADIPGHVPEPDATSSVNNVYNSE